MKPVRSRACLAIAVFVLTLSGAPAQGAPTVKKAVLVTIPATLELKAPPAKVWTTLTAVEGLCALAQCKAGGNAKAVARVGDNFPATLWEDPGRVVVTEFVPEKELRIAFEPAKGHYVCATRILLRPSSGGTTLEYWDRYSDDQANVDETARQAAAETEKALEAFKKLAEK